MIKFDYPIPKENFQMEEFGKYGDLEVNLRRQTRNQGSEITSDLIRSPELEPTPEIIVVHPRFNWVAFIVMIISIGAALLVGMILPGILDEYIFMFIITTLYGFIQAHGFNTPKMKK